MGANGGGYRLDRIGLRMRLSTLGVEWICCCC